MQVLEQKKEFKSIEDEIKFKSRQLKELRQKYKQLQASTSKGRCSLPLQAGDGGAFLLRPSHRWSWMSLAAAPNGSASR